MHFLKVLVVRLIIHDDSRRLFVLARMTLGLGNFRRLVRLRWFWDHDLFILCKGLKGCVEFLRPVDLGGGVWTRTFPAEILKHAFTCFGVVDDFGLLVLWTDPGHD